jgi:hypothetical protein
MGLAAAFVKLRRAKVAGAEEIFHLGTGLSGRGGFKTELSSNKGIKR